jgi:hypothetical protein
LAEAQLEIRAAAGSHYDFWLTDDGIYRVEVLPTRLSIVYSLAPVLVLFAVSGYLVPPQGTILYPVYSLIFVFLFYFSLLYTPKIVGWRRRKLPPYSNLADAKNHPSLTVKFGWEKVRNMTLVRGQFVRIDIEGETRRNQVRVKVSRAQADKLKSALQPKLGERFDFRDGMFR